MEGKLPNLLIIGAMKAGTTSLHDYLSLHPDIFMSNPKEIHFFADNNYLTKDIECYKSFFQTEKPVRGTSPQSYTKCHNKYYKGIPERIKMHIPDVKMIYILRDPIERYRSHILDNYYNEPPHDVKYNIETGHYLKTSMYFMQLSEYLKYFDLNRIHILTLEDLAQNKLKELNKIFDFLNVKRLNNSSIFNFKSNDHRNKVIPFWIKKSYLYRGSCKIFPDFTDKVLNSQFVQKLLRKEKIQFSANELANLEERIKDDVNNLRKLTGIQFKNWSI